MQQSATVIPLNTPRPDRKAKRRSRSWKGLHRKCGTKLKKPAQYNVIEFVA